MNLTESIRRYYEQLQPKYITWEFYEKYIDVEPPFGQLGLVVFLRTYSRYIKDLGRREKFCEVCLRVVEYSLSLDNITSVEKKKEEAALLYDDLFNLRSLCAGRTLWVANTKITAKDSSANFNCTASTIKDLTSIVEGFYLLLVGAGFGFSVEKKYIEKLPKFYRSKQVTHKDYTGWVKGFDDTVLFTDERFELTFKPVVESKDNAFADYYGFNEVKHVIITVGDSKEGWVMALKSYLAALTSPTVQTITFDYNWVRPEGELLKTFGGRSSGYKALQQLFDDIYTVTQELDSDDGQQLNSAQVMDLVNAVGLAVVVGGVRRSSQLVLADEDDKLIRDAKKNLWSDPALENKRRTRVMSNNSLALYDNPGLEWFQTVIDSVKTTGEPGFISVGNANKKDPTKTRKVFNPCFAAGTLVMTRNGDYPIEELVGQTVEVFDGSDWIKIDNFRVTGENQEVWQLVVDNEFNVVATPYHTFILNNGERKQLRELEIGDVLKEVHGGVGCKVTRIQPYGVADKVYCCTVPTNNSFALSYGLLVGNCAEILLDDKGVCNLTEVYLPKHVTQNNQINYITLERSLGLATRMGSRITLVEMFHKDWNAVQKRDRLLGVSLSGVVDFFELVGISTKEQEETFYKWCKGVVHKVADAYHDELGIPKSLLKTTIKPSGTLSTLVGCGSGIHRSYAPYYYRRVRVSVNDPIAMALKDIGVPVNPENGQGETINDDGVNTWVFTFPVKTDTKIKAIDESAITQLERYRNAQVNYVDHNVSFTCSVDIDEWDDVATWLYENYDDFIGVSFLPKFDSTNSPYPQLPYEVCEKEQYEELKKDIPSMSENDFLQVLQNYEKLEDEYEILEDACGGKGCPLR